ncbi:MAG: patatin-like phospholipase family protein [Hyphomicrobium sp.]
MQVEAQRAIRGLQSALRTTFILLIAAVTAGCAATLPRNALPEKLVEKAELSGMDGVRIWGDAPPSQLQAMVSAELKLRGKAAIERSNAHPVSNFLAISGGAEDGAFGAGLLTGWTAAGTRPEFDLVTGVSAGALIAPFAFLGSRKDPELKAMFTQYGRDDILSEDVLSGIFGGPALADSAPLARLIAKYVDRDFLREVAAERIKGRVLLICTTNLDAQRPVLWDMGRIAMSGHPEALSLFRKILLASASVPGAFPPVRIQVRANGKDYDEMHVDGGVTQQVFLAPTALAFKDIDHAAGQRVTRRLFILRNGKITPEWQSVDDKVIATAGRSISTLIKSQSIGDLYRIYTTTARDGIDFNLATIPRSFNVKSMEPFDRTYMRALYEVGYREGVDGYRWMKAPPGMTAEVR